MLVRDHLIDAVWPNKVMEAKTVCMSGALKKIMLSLHYQEKGLLLERNRNYLLEKSRNCG